MMNNAQLAERHMSPVMFSGCGLRTLASMGPITSQGTTTDRCGPTRTRSSRPDSFATATSSRCSGSPQPCLRRPNTRKGGCRSCVADSAASTLMNAYLTPQHAPPCLGYYHAHHADQGADRLLRRRLSRWPLVVSRAPRILRRPANHKCPHGRKPDHY